MILGTTVKMLARQVPNYHLVSQGIAKGSLTVCACRNCLKVKRDENGHLVCGRVIDRVEDEGWAIVASNGTCDRAEFNKCNGGEIVLEG